MISKLKNLFKITRTLSIDDTGAFQYTTSSWMGKTQKTLSLKPYGLISNPPTSSMGATFAVGCKESNEVTIVDDPNLRPKNLVSGEVGLSNFITGDIMKFESVGLVSLVTALLILTGNLSVDGDITNTGSITSSGDITATNLASALISATKHTHNVSAVGNPTGPPLP